MTLSELNEMRKSLEDMKAQEEAYMNMKKSYQSDQSDKLKNMQKNMAEILVNLENKRKEYEYNEEKLHILDREYEEMINKRELTKLVADYIDILNELDSGFKLTGNNFLKPTDNVENGGDGHSERGRSNNNSFDTNQTKRSKARSVTRSPRARSPREDERRAAYFANGRAKSKDASMRKTPESPDRKQ